MNIKHGSLVATAVATLLSTAGCGSKASEPTSSASQEVKCQGINECKGTSECAGKEGDAAHGCQGLNSCKGLGWITAPSAQECTSKGGSIITG